MTGIDIALATTPGPGPWAHDARCRNAPAEIFFPTRGESLDPARAICAHCPVIAECRDYAIEISELHGVWGGLSENERRRERKARQAALQARRAETANPAPTKAAAGSLQATLTELTAHPRRWAIVGHFAAPGSAATTASLLRAGKRKAPPGGRWQFEGRRSDQGGSDLWARYTPTPNTDQLLAAGQ
jgi:WhiB family transcriptional regulator, redox-sensing transcriptional regulator